MKTIYKSFLLAIIAAAGFTACSDYEAPDLPDTSAVKIISQETSLPAAASTGSVTFEAKGPVTVTSSAQWLTASVEGDVINLSADQNNSLYGRAATVTVKCGSATDEISVLQSGVIFKFTEVGKIETGCDPASFTYEISSNVPIEVTSDAEWLSGSTADGVLTISVAENPKLAPRDGSLKVSSGDTNFQIPVSQSGIYFPLSDVKDLYLNDDSNVKTYTFNSSLAMDFQTDVDWIKADYTNNVITLTVDENNEGHVRAGELTWSVDGLTGSIAISQHDFDKDIAGEYYFTFYDYFNNFAFQAYPASLTRSGTSYTLKVVDTEWNNLLFTIPVDYNDENMTLTMSSNSSAIGMYSVLYCYLLPATLDEDGLGLYYTRDQKMNATFEYTVSSSSAATIASFENDPTNALDLIGYSIAAFTSTTLSNNTSKGNLEIMIYPSLIRMETASSTTSANALADINKLSPVKRLTSIPFKTSARQATSARLSLPR